MGSQRFEIAPIKSASEEEIIFQVKEKKSSSTCCGRNITTLLVTNSLLKWASVAFMVTVATFALFEITLGASELFALKTYLPYSIINIAEKFTYEGSIALVASGCLKLFFLALFGNYMAKEVVRVGQETEFYRILYEKNDII